MACASRVVPARPFESWEGAERLAEIDRQVRAEREAMERLHGQPTGERCDICGGDLRYGDETAVDMDGTSGHLACFDGSSDSSP